LVNLILVALLTFALSWRFVRFGRTYSNRLEFAQVLPFIGMAIAVGLGLGADQRPSTIVAFVVIMGAMSSRSLLLRKEDKHILYPNVEVPQPAGGEDPDGEQQTIQYINRFLSQHASLSRGASPMSDLP